jgi:AraC-like DNA-binding protein
MAKIVEPTQTIRPLDNSGVWIEGKLEAPPQGVSGPLVIGAGWLLEMLRNEAGTTLGFFWAPFAIIRDFPDLSGMWNGRFVGFSMPGNPPASWLTVSMVFDLGDVPLARTPQEFASLLTNPLPHTSMEGRAWVSPVSRKAKSLIASNYRADVAIGDIARKLGVSHAHLTRQFKHDYGLTPVGYRHRLRVSEAVGRLSQGEKILDIGFDVGFNDTTRFYDDFRKVTGTSPGKCRGSRR